MRVSDAPGVMRLGEGHAREVRKAADTEIDQAAPVALSDRDADDGRCRRADLDPTRG
jgi:hypothetical protein